AAEEPRARRPLARQCIGRPGEHDEPVAASRDTDPYGRGGVREPASSPGRVVELIAQQLFTARERQPAPGGLVAANARHREPLPGKRHARSAAEATRVANSAPPC